MAEQPPWQRAVPSRLMKVLAARMQNPVCRRPYEPDLPWSTPWTRPDYTPLTSAKSRRFLPARSYAKYCAAVKFVPTPARSAGGPVRRAPRARPTGPVTPRRGPDIASPPARPGPMSGPFLRVTPVTTESRRRTFPDSPCERAPRASPHTFAALGRSCTQ
ncbi:hypothetical protein F750_2075 [Streptomyces sp. PAMC 26508]|nr:hypothetical protein F750_2075 [Streptomyces sp. PAMC 26508]